MARPPIGAEIKTTEGMTAKVLKELGSGGQGTVYMVDYGHIPLSPAATGTPPTDCLSARCF